MTETKEKEKEESLDRFVLDDVKGLKLDRSEEEGDPLDMGADDDVANDEGKE